MPVYVCVDIKFINRTFSGPRGGRDLSIGSQSLVWHTYSRCGTRLEDLSRIGSSIPFFSRGFPSNFDFPTSQPINQSTNQPINQSINKKINQPMCFRDETGNIRKSHMAGFEPVSFNRRRRQKLLTTSPGQPLNQSSCV